MSRRLRGLALALTLIGSGFGAGFPPTTAWAAAGAVRLAVHSHPVMPGPRSESPLDEARVNQGSVSNNWAGYDLVSTPGAFSAASGCWTVPAVSPTPGTTASATWLGIDGGIGSDDFLIQTGTEQDWAGGSAQYYAWWEVLTPTSTPPATPIGLVHPGDAMCAAVGEVSPGEWSISLDDSTTGGSFQQDVAYSGPGETAEWVVERPAYGCVEGGGCLLTTLADFGSVSFDQATLNGSNPDLISSESLTMEDASTGMVLATPSAPAADGAGFTVIFGAASGAASPTASAYVPLVPFRVCDTRTGSGTPCAGLAVGAGAILVFQVTGITGPQGQPVPATALSVVLNVTAIEGTAGTYLTVYPDGTFPPTASNLNVAAGAIQANLVVVPVGMDGRVAIYNSEGLINVAVDVEGYFSATAGGSATGLFHPVAPLRICDTRSGSGTACAGTPVSAGEWIEVNVTGCPTGDTGCAASVPGDGTAAAVALNLTAVQGTAGTFLTVSPPAPSGSCPAGAPNFSNLNLGAGQILPNRVIVPLGPTEPGGPDQAVCVYNSVGTINVILDLDGWFGNGSETSPGASFYAVTPERICDTRSPAATGYVTECSGQTVSPGGILDIEVAGVDGIPGAVAGTSPVALVANVTAVQGTAGTYLTLYPSDVPLPAASDLNAGAGQIVPNLVLVQVAASGTVDLYNAQGSIDVVVDVAGWFGA